MSRYAVLIAPRVRTQLERILAWWSKNRPENPVLVAIELDEMLGILAVAPSSGAPYTATRIRGVRRVLLSRTRYHLYYRVLEKEQIIRVLAIWHTARGQAPKL